MSFQALTWAIDQVTGGPSAKGALMSIANYANDKWVSYPSQQKIAQESEQSADSVQRRLVELVKRGLVRRIPLRFQGRRSVDFFILAPSPYFAAAVEMVVPLLPRGFEVMTDAAADCGSDQKDTNAETPAAGDADAPAACGSVEPRTPPQTLPQSAADAAALVRQQEPVTEPVESPPYPPPGGVSEPSAEGGEQQIDEPDGFADFFEHYPGWRLMDRARAADVFRQLAPVQREGARAAVRPLAAECEKFKRRPVDAHKWLDRLGFESFPEGRRRFVLKDSEAWAAWKVFQFFLRRPMPEALTRADGQEGATMPAEWPPFGRGVSADLATWRFVERYTPQSGRWSTFVMDLAGEKLPEAPFEARWASTAILNPRGAEGRDIRGWIFPSEWPPAKAAKPEGG